MNWYWHLAYLLFASACGAMGYFMAYCPERDDLLEEVIELSKDNSRLRRELKRINTVLSMVQTDSEMFNKREEDI